MNVNPETTARGNDAVGGHLCRGRVEGVSAQPVGDGRPGCGIPLGCCEADGGHGVRCMDRVAASREVIRRAGGRGGGEGGGRGLRSRRGHWAQVLVDGCSRGGWVIDQGVGEGLQLELYGRQLELEAGGRAVQGGHLPRGLATVGGNGPAQSRFTVSDCSRARACKL